MDAGAADGERPRPREVQPLESEEIEDDPGESRFSTLHRQLSDSLDSTRLAGQYTLPVAAPDLVGDRPDVFSVPEDEAGAEAEVEAGSALDQCACSLEAWSSRLLQTQDGALSLRLRPWLQLVLIVTFLLVDASKYILAPWALHGKHCSHILAQGFVLSQSLAALVSGLIVTVAWEGVRGLGVAVQPREVLRWLPVSLGFSLSAASVWHAFSRGLGAATCVAVGFLYMPLSAVISRWLFRREYGWLEAYALALLTLSILAFTELRSRAMLLSENSQGVGYVVLSVVFSCLASLLSEWVLKPKYSRRGETAPAFCVQKVRIEVWGAITSSVLLWLLVQTNTAHRCVADWDGDIPWDGRLVAALLVAVGQSWMAGLLAKHLSTVAKAVLQCLSSLLVFFFGDLVLFGKNIGSVPISLLAMVVALSALMYQMGRRSTQARGGAGTAPESAPAGTGSMLLEQENASAPTTYASTPVVVPEAQAMAPNEFRPGEHHAGFWPQCPQLEGLIDRGWLARARSSNARLAAWASSRTGLAVQLAWVAAFIVADATRTLVYAWALNGAAIVQQSVVVAMSAALIVVGLGMSGTLDGKAGLKAALNPREVVRYLPVSACFSLGLTCTVFAYGAGISAVLVTVLGYAYIPLSALLSRWIFKRRYNNLEWHALTLMVLCVVVFVLLQNAQGGGSISLLGVVCVLVSVLLSCVASMLAEKFMKAGGQPFYVQNVNMQIGSFVTACLMLFVDGALSTRKDDAFWRPRDIGGGVLEDGIFVAWSLRTVAALAASTLQSWLAGFVAKRLSTVTRSVAQCLELVLIYVLGDLVFKGVPFDWPVGVMALAVALTVVVFAQAGLKGKEAGEAPRSTTASPRHGGA